MTGILMLVLFAIVIGLDTYLALDSVRANTYSARLRAWGKAWPPIRLIVCFGLGVVVGHVWWAK